MLKIENDVRSYGINIPTSLDEITPAYFENLLKNVKLAKNYCIVALCAKDSLYGCINGYKVQTKTSTTIIPLIAKANGYEAEVGDRVIIEPSSLERALHINVPNNVIGYNFIGNYCEEDKEFCENVFKGDIGFIQSKIIGVPKKSIPCYFVEFKIVPFVDIKATYSMKDEFNCIYKVPKAELN